MNSEEIRDLIREFQDSTLSLLEIKVGDTYLKMKKPEGEQTDSSSAQAPAFIPVPYYGSPAPAYQPAPAPGADPSAPTPAGVAASAPMPYAGAPDASAVQAPEEDSKQLVEVVSPIVGVFYEAPAPGEKPFVSVGDHVEEGDILCLMEAMKMISEVKSPCAGTIREICASNEEAVGCDQVLIRIEAD